MTICMPPPNIFGGKSNEFSRARALRISSKYFSDKIVGVICQGHGLTASSYLICCLKMELQSLQEAGCY